MSTLLEPGAVLPPPVAAAAPEAEETFAFPASFAQERMWFLERLAPGGSTYAVPAVLRLMGELDERALRSALAALAERHEALRTTFAEEDGRPVQVVHARASLALEVEDLSTAGDPRAAARERLAALAATPFDLRAGPLFRATLLRVGRDEHLLLLLLHHLVCDGWSVGLLLRELPPLYAAAREGRPAELPALPVQYADFAAWQREHLSGDRLDAALAWWRERLAGAPGSLDLPCDAVGGEPGDAGAVHAFPLPAGTAAAAAALGREEGATPFMVYCAAWAALLGRYAGADDLVVGTPAAGRTRSEVEGVVGLFVNTLPLRVGLGGDPEFRALVRRVRDVAVGAFARQEVPLEKVVEEVRPGAARGHAPLFQAVIALQNAAGPAPAAEWGGGLRAEPAGLEARVAHFDLALHLEGEGDALRGVLEYRTARFSHATARRIARHFAALLAAALAAPGRPLSRLAGIDADEMRQLAAWNHTARPFPRDACAHELFAARAAAAPDAPALLWEGETLSFARLDARAERLARALRRLGVRPETRVGVCLERGPELVAAVLAVWKAGGVFVPLDPAYPAERLRHLLADAAVPVLVTRSALAERLPETDARFLRLDEEPDAAGDRDPSAARPHPENLAYLIYTSGSTGRPKGVAVPHRALVNLLAGSADALAIGPGDVSLSLASFAFDIWLFETFAPLLAGAAVRLVPDERAGDPGRLAADVAGCTVLHAVPALMRALLRAAPGAFAGLRRVLTGGDRVPPDLLAGLAAAAPDAEVRVLYGPTEATILASTFAVPGDGAVAGHPIGAPLPNVRLHVLDPSGALLPTGAAGELCIGGEGVARGFLGRPAATAERFVPDPFGPPGARLYRTGDRVRRRPDGTLEFLGRTDQQVKVRGFRIEPGEVEAALRAHPAVREAVVDACSAPGGEARLVAWVVPAQGGGVSPAALREHLAARLPAHLVPGAFVAIPALPLSPHGKVDRRALPAPDAPGDGEFVAPRTPAEEVVAAVWAELLGAARVGPHDHFFDLGGHSLLAARVVSRLRDAFGVELPLRAVFDAPTVAGLAARLEAARGARPLPPIEPADRGEPIPLSWAQERLWFLDRLEPGGSAYNLPLALRLTGPLDAGALEAALGGVVDRHESLRTRFAVQGGTPVQVIGPAGGFVLEREDLAGLPEDAVAARVRALADEPFDLAAGPLFRASLLRLGDGEHLLLLRMHHVVADGWSMGVLHRETAALYAAALRGAEAGLPPLAVQYADFAAWQRRHLAGERMERQLAWWRERMAGAPGLLDLTTDRPRPATSARRAGRVEVRLGESTAAGVRALARAEGATPFMVLLAAFTSLLGRCASTDDVVVGTPVAGRTRPETEGMIGFFVNTLPLRVDLSRDPSFRALLARVREAVLGAFAHQDVPFERLVEELAPGRSRGHQPLVQVMFAWQGEPAELPALEGVRAEPVGVRAGSARFDLALSLQPAPGGGVCGTLEYDAELFDPSTAGRLAAHFTRLVEGALADPARPAAALPLLDPTEREQVLAGFNRTARPYPRELCIHHAFAAQAARTPDAAALEHPGGILTYAQLDRAANRLARHLRRVGVGPETRVGVCLDRGPWLLQAILGVLKAGGAWVPFDPAYPAERLAYMLSDSAVPVLLTRGALADALPGDGIRIVRLDADAAAIDGEPDTDPAVAADPLNLAYVIYTSGSTGRPKGVAVPHRGVINLARYQARMLGTGPGVRVLQLAALSFDGSVSEILGALLTGATLVAVPRDEVVPGAPLAATLRAKRITKATLPPSALAVLPGGDYPDLRVLMAVGEACPPALARRWAAGRRFCNGYGPTETTVCAAIAAGLTGHEPRLPIGGPMDNAAAYVLDARMEPVPVGVPGELYVGGDGVSRGYLGRPGLTAERFVPDPFGGRPGRRLYRTGDRVRWLPDGRMEFLGRVDRQLKLRGFRVEPGEVESALRAHPAVRDAAVAVRDGAGGPRLVAYVVPAAGAPPPAGDLRAWAQERLPDFMVPSVYVSLDALPLSPSGKLDRDRLPAPPAPAEARVAPRDATERALAELWEEVLGAPVGVTDDFFALGGHSLLAARLMDRVRERFGRELPLAMLFDGATVERMAAALRQVRAAPAREPLVRITAGDPARPALFAVHPIGGNLLVYRELARHLGDDQPFWGVQDLDAEGRTRPSIEEMAAGYVGRIRGVQQRGPYFLAGQSFGGTVAFEMARQLAAAGDEVALLALIDTRAPSITHAADAPDDAAVLAVLAREHARMHGVELPLAADELRGLPLAAQLARVAERLEETGGGARLDLATLERVHRLFLARQEAAQAYAPAAYPGGLVLFRAAGVHPADARELPGAARAAREHHDFGWGAHAAGPVEVRFVPGDHVTMSLPPHVAALAAALRAAIDRAAGGARNHRGEA